MSHYDLSNIPGDIDSVFQRMAALLTLKAADAVRGRGNL